MPLSEEELQRPGSGYDVADETMMQLYRDKYGDWRHEFWLRGWEISAKEYQDMLDATMHQLYQGGFWSPGQVVTTVWQRKVWPARD